MATCFLMVHWQTDSKSNIRIRRFLSGCSKAQLMGVCLPPLNRQVNLYPLTNCSLGTKDPRMFENDPSVLGEAEGPSRNRWVRGSFRYSD